MEEKSKQAQQILHKNLGSDWNDLCQTLYESRVLVSMVEFSNQVQAGVKPACEQCNKYEECEIRKLVWFDIHYPKPLCKFFCSEFESQ